MIAFYIFSALLILLSLKSFRGGIGYLRFFRQELSKPEPSYAPFATVIAPCRGVDPGLRDNLAALSIQEYADFEIIFVVDDERDAALPVINEILRTPSETMSAQLIVAPKARRSAQKVENIGEYP